MGSSAVAEAKQLVAMWDDLTPDIIHWYIELFDAGAGDWKMRCVECGLIFDRCIKVTDLAGHCVGHVPGGILSEQKSDSRYK